MVRNNWTLPSKVNARDIILFVLKRYNTIFKRSFWSSVAADADWCWCCCCGGGGGSVVAAVAAVLAWAAHYIGVNATNLKGTLKLTWKISSLCSTFSIFKSPQLRGIFFCPQVMPINLTQSMLPLPFESYWDTMIHGIMSKTFWCVLRQRPLPITG